MVSRKVSKAKNRKENERKEPCAPLREKPNCNSTLLDKLEVRNLNKTNYYKENV